MLINMLIAYYGLSVLYIIMMAILKRKGAGIQAMILIACPFISIFLLFAMSKRPNKDGALPDWLLRHEQYEDTSLQSPHIEKEINIIPFDDSLMLNNPKIKRSMLIDLLKSEFLQHVNALEKALKSDDSETSHYAATAVQQAKGELMNSMRKLEAQLQDNEGDLEALKAYSEVIKQYIRIEFLDVKTRKKYMYTYLHIVNQLIEKALKPDPEYYEEKIRTALQLNEHQTALSTAAQFLEKFPEREEAYFLAMHVHYQMRNKAEFSKTIELLRTSHTTLSPERLNQLRFWLQGDQYEKQV